MNTKTIVTFLVVLGLFNVKDVNAGNPGVDAMGCVKITRKNTDYDNLIFHNQCNYQIFVTWCGSFKFNKKKCGDGPNKTYYTRSANISANKSQSTTIVKGSSYKYAACKGKIGFGTKGIKHPSSNAGSYTCTKTGSW